MKYGLHCDAFQWPTTTASGGGTISMVGYRLTMYSLSIKATIIWAFLCKSKIYSHLPFTHFLPCYVIGFSHREKRHRTFTIFLTFCTAIYNIYQIDFGSHKTKLQITSSHTKRRSLQRILILTCIGIFLNPLEIEDGVQIVNIVNIIDVRRVLILVMLLRQGHRNVSFVLALHRDVSGCLIVWSSVYLFLRIFLILRSLALI